MSLRALELFLKRQMFDLVNFYAHTHLLTEEKKVKRNVLFTSMSFLFLSTIFGTCLSPLFAEPLETTISVDPLAITASLGATFTVNVTVADVENLYSYQFKLSWNPSFLEVNSVIEGPFLDSEGTYATFFQPKIYNTPDALGVSGYMYVASSLLGEPATAAASGKGTLATIEFLVREIGNTSLHLYETQLVNSAMVKMPHQTKDGSLHYGDYIIVDASFVSDERADVTSVQTFGFHAKWRLNSSDVVGGSIFVNGTEYITNGTGWISVDVSSSTVGREEWVVTKVNCSGVTIYVQEASNPSIIWDQIQIVDGGSTRGSTIIGNLTTIWFQAKYEYDVVFSGTKGILYVNGSEMSWSSLNDRWEYNYVAAVPGPVAFVITGVSDNMYDLGGIKDKVGPQTIIFLEGSNLTVSLDCLTSYVGYKVQINGTLAYMNATGIAGADLLLSYSVTDGKSWNDISSFTTQDDGSYYVEWMPTATGNYLVRVVWEGDQIPFVVGTEVRVTLAVIPIGETYVSVVSTSTVSSLIFDSTQRRISYTVTGPSETSGYANVYVANTLVGNMEDVEVYLDNQKIDHAITPFDDSWVIHFSYLDSPHEVIISLSGRSVSFGETWLGKVLLFGIPVVIVVVLILFYAMKKKQRNRMHTKSKAQLVN